MDACTLIASAAHQQAKANLAANLAVLGEWAEALMALPTPEPLDFVHARDGFLSARTSEGWLSGCSLPYRAAAAMCQKLAGGGVAACLLAPNHAGQIRAVLDRLKPEQALLAIIPRTLDLRLMLHCDDFSAELRSGRLWLVAGDDWARQLEALLTRQRGLPTPQQFIRLPTCDETTAQSLIAAAQPVFARVNSDRAGRIAALRAQTPGEPEHGPMAIAGPMRFALWDDAPATLAQAVTDEDRCQPYLLDTSDPTCASTLALAEHVQGCAALVCADAFRADMPGVVSDELPWITWVTAGRIAPPAAHAPRDRLLLTDAAWIKPAIAAGWERSRLALAAWPIVTLASPPVAPACLALITDVGPLDAPPELDDYSSHRVVWDTLRLEIEQNPFCIGGDIESFLTERMRRLGIANDRFPRRRFIQELILPAYAIALANVLIKAGVPLRLHGRGWSQIKPQGTQAFPVDSRALLHQAVAGATALVHPHPAGLAHPIQGFNRPVLAAPRSASELLALAREALSARPRPQRSSQPLNAPLLRQHLAQPVARTGASV